MTGLVPLTRLTAVCTSNLCNVTLSIDTTSVGASYADVSNVDFKIGTTDSLTGTLTAPTSNWSTVTSSLSSGGRLGGNHDGQICSSASGDFADTGGKLTWMWTNVRVTGDLTIGYVGYKYDTSDTLGKGFSFRMIMQRASLSRLLLAYWRLVYSDSRWAARFS